MTALEQATKDQWKEAINRELQSQRLTSGKEAQASDGEKVMRSSHSSYTLERWDVLADDGAHVIQADSWVHDGNGLQFHRDGECVAWFASWLWFKKFDLVSDPKGFIRLGFSPRTRNALDRLECKTIGELFALSDHEIMQARNIGKGVVAEIREKLASAGFKRELDRED